MIAEEQSRRKGLAAEALRLLMAYAIAQLRVTCFCAKIGFANAASQQLFRKLGFAEVKRVEVFQELHLALDAESAAWAELTALGERLDIGQYDSEV